MSIHSADSTAEYLEWFRQQPEWEPSPCQDREGKVIPHEKSQTRSCEGRRDVKKDKSVEDSLRREFVSKREREQANRENREKDRVKRQQRKERLHRR
jgi:hypothetical protein